MRIRPWFVIVSVCLTGTTMVFGKQKLNLPQIASGAGAIKTTVIAFNNNDRPSNVEIKFRNDGGELLTLSFVDEGDTSQLSFTLQPGETRFFETTGQEEDLAVGSAMAEASVPIGLSSIFSILGPFGVVTEAGVGVSPPVEEFAIAVDTVVPFNTGIALQDLSGGSNKVAFRFTPVNPGPGNQPRETTRNLPGFGHLAVFVGGTGGLFSDLNNARGRLSVSSAGPVAAVTLRQGTSGSPLTTLPVVRTDSTQSVFELPQVATGSTISTQFIMYGLGESSSQPGEVEIELTRDDGSPFAVDLDNGLSGSSFSLSLNPTGVLFLETETGGEVFAGGATVRSSIPIGVTAIFRLLDAEGNLVTEAGVGDSPPLYGFSLPVDQAGGFGTGLAFFNNGSQTATVEYQFIGEAGQVASASARTQQAQNSIVLEPFEHRALFVRELIEGAAGRRGQLAVTTDKAISALTLRQGGSTLTSLPVSPGIVDPNGAVDDVRVETGVDRAQEAFGVTGRDVIVAIVDRGIDYEHPDFIDAEGNTRILAILDLTDDTGGNNPYGTGTIYTQNQIQAALDTGVRLATRDAVGHGIATAGLTGGNGRASEGRIQGMAPDARFVIVKFTSTGAPAHDGEEAEDPFNQPNLLGTALDFVADQAEDAGLPVVVVANFGSIQGPSDGTSNHSREIDEYFDDRSGWAFLTGSSDDGGVPNHASGTLEAGETVDILIHKGHSGNLRFDLWYSESDRFDVTIVTPSGTFGPYAAASGPANRETQQTADFTYTHNGRDVDFFVSTGPNREILIDFNGPAGDYVVRLTGSTVDDGLFHAIINPSNIFSHPQNRFDSFAVDGYTIWDAASSNGNICTNSYVLAPTWTDIDGIPNRTQVGNDVGAGALWPGSGIGPTWDGRRGIVVSAPGNAVFTTYSPRSYWATLRANVLPEGEPGQYGVLGFVSGANPVLGGIVALMLEADPTLDDDDIKAILERTARQDEFTGEVPNTSWGHGKVDAFRAIADIRGVSLP